MRDKFQRVVGNEISGAQTVNSADLRSQSSGETFPPRGHFSGTCSKTARRLSNDSGRFIDWKQDCSQEDAILASPRILN